MAASYDATSFRLYVVIKVNSDTDAYQREVGWIEGTSEADLLSKLLSGNYDIHIAQHQTPYRINAGLFLNPAPLAR